MRNVSDEIWDFELRLVHKMRRLFSSQTLLTLTGMLEFVSVLLLLLFVFSLRQFLAIWAFGEPTFLSLLAYIGFFLWNTIDLIILKVVNRDLLLESQAETWGFGQTLPLVLTGSVVFMIADARRRL